MQCQRCHVQTCIIHISDKHLCESCHMGILNEKQWRFTYLTALLILYAFAKGYKLRYDAAYATTGHKFNSFHYKHLAVDFSLFDAEGNYLDKTEDHTFLGEFWESLDPECTWGGRFEDGNHYSYGE